MEYKSDFWSSLAEAKSSQSDYFLVVTQVQEITT